MRRSFSTLLRASQLAVTTIALAGVFHCRREPGPNVLLITLDTVRSDHTSAYGYPRQTTPSLEGVAREGARLDLAYAPMATTAPSHASMFTGFLPVRHGVLKNGYTLDDTHTTLAEVLRKRGYATAAVVSSYVLDRRFGLAQGFEQYFDSFDPGNPSLKLDVWEGKKFEGVFDQRAGATSSRAGETLKSLTSGKRQPFFLWVHYFDAHAPYDPPPEFQNYFSQTPDGSDLDRSIRNYDREIRYVDSEMEKLLAALRSSPQNANTLVVILGDHGEGLMQHGHMEHGLQIYEEAVRVPLIFRWPGRIREGTQLAHPVRVADLGATILDLTAGSAENFPGTSFAGPLRGEGLIAQQDIVLQRRLFDENAQVGGQVIRGLEFALRRGTWKYIEARGENRYELYDLGSDPGETKNVIESQPAVRARMADALERWVRREFARGARRQNISDEDRKRLEALGYIQ
jgi:arylsulfatase A-like enzyme